MATRRGPNPPSLHSRFCYAVSPLFLPSPPLFFSNGATRSDNDVAGKPVSRRVHATTQTVRQVLSRSFVLCFGGQVGPKCLFAPGIAGAGWDCDSTLYPTRPIRYGRVRTRLGLQYSFFFFSLSSTRGLATSVADGADSFSLDGLYDGWCSCDEPHWPGTHDVLRVCYTNNFLIMLWKGPWC